MLHAARTTTAKPEPVQSFSDWASARLRALSGCALPERFEAWNLHGALAQLGSADPARRAAGERCIARWRAEPSTAHAPWRRVPRRNATSNNDFKRYRQSS